MQQKICGENLFRHYMYYLDEKIEKTGTYLLFDI